MLQARIIPCLLLKGQGLVKGKNFREHKYVGDPINAVKIFNYLEADELLFLDISATAEKRLPPLDLVQKIADQSLMPFGVGGGISSVEDAKSVIQAGAEKVCLNTTAFENPKVITDVANVFGNQAVVVSVDYRIINGKKRIFTRCGKHEVKTEFGAMLNDLTKMGAGEIIINSIDKEGSFSGYDIQTIQEVSKSVKVPVLASGGASSIDDLNRAIKEGCAQAAVAGSMFVFHGPRRAVLINYPSKEELAVIRNNYSNE